MPRLYSTVAAFALAVVVATADLPTVDAACQAVQAMLNHARANSQGYPDGRCYFHVANFIDAVGYAGFAKRGRSGDFNSRVPSAYHAEARMFAEWANRGLNLWTIQQTTKT